MVRNAARSHGSYRKAINLYGRLLTTHLVFGLDVLGKAPARALRSRNYCAHPDSSSGVETMKRYARVLCFGIAERHASQAVTYEARVPQAAADEADVVDHEGS